MVPFCYNMHLMIEVPKGYHFEEADQFGTMLSKNDGKEAFVLINREFGLINHVLGYLPSQYTEFFIDQKIAPVRVLDIGAGRNSVAANGLQERYKEKVSVIALDLLPANQKSANIMSIAGDATALPIRDETIDVVYSFQLLSHMENDGTYQKGTAVLREIARVLKPGGVAILDEEFYSVQSPMNKVFTKFFIEENCFMFQKSGNNSEPGTISPGLPRPILFLGKNPLDPGIFRIQEKLVGNF